MTYTEYVSQFEKIRLSFPVETQNTFESFHRAGYKILTDSTEQLTSKNTQIDVFKECKRVESKVVKLIITFRKTNSEIQEILKAQDIIITNRTINDIKKKNHIKNYSYVD